MKVAILGKLPSKFQAPFDDPSVQIWGSNVHKDFFKIPRYDLWFDVHDKKTRRFSKWLEQNIPSEKLITIDNYPYDEVRKFLYDFYLNNVTSMMIAYAILKGATHIGLYGCKFSNDSEIREGQKESVRLLLMLAYGKGCKIYSAEPSLIEGWKLYK